jgi:predicted DNA-binding transcriptional regulator YafY
VPRNAEVIRQWTILREIERARGGGVTLDDLAALCDVTTRTIRRDLQALEEAGFPLYDDRAADDGKTRWRMNGQAFKGLAAGLTVSELLALYFSRTLVEALSVAPFRDDVESAFEKLAAGLTPHMRQFVDQLPRMIAIKPDPLRRRTAAGDDEDAGEQTIARAIDAILHHRQATISYYSRSSERQKDYLVHPYRLAHAQGGLYLLAYVPEYGEVRTFATERIHNVSLRKERFTTIEELPDIAFPHSLGVHSGAPQRVEVEFLPAVADYVRTREWHPSQQVTETGSGGVIVTLDVCIDPALRSWVLGFGATARVLSPDRLAREIAGEFERAAELYRTLLKGATAGGPP